MGHRGLTVGTGKSLFFLLLLLASSASAQTVHLTGTVCERGTKSGVPGASLHILGTTHGARTNAEGDFRLSLERGTKYTIQIAAIGYRPDTLRLELSQDSAATIALWVAPIPGRTITVSASSSREEARRIMHKVIDTKDAWQLQIEDYTFQAYSRGDIRVGKDSTIFGILESVANGYWKRGRGYAEEITARHETADIPAEVNRIGLFDVENFYNDRIQVDDYSVVSPVAHDAFSRYDYDLLGEGTLNGADVWKISVEPLNSLFPAFFGTLWIDKADYTIVYLDLSPNDAIQLGPIKNVHLTQTFSFVQNKFWMPSDMNFRLEVKLDLPVVPVFRFSQSATLQNYVINGGLSDSLFQPARHNVAASADSLDSVHWVAMRTIPLAADEDTAYHVFDSLARRSDSISLHPTPPSFDALSLAFDALSPHLYQYNRVEGSHFELEHDWTLNETHPLTLNLMAGYGVQDARWKYAVGLMQALTTAPARGFVFNLPLGGDVHMASITKRPPTVTSSIGARVYDTYVRRSVEYDPLVNTLTALLLHSDYPDYFRARGFEIEYQLSPQRNYSLSLEFRNEDETSLPNATDFSLLDKRDTFRLNPPVDEGRLHELSLNADAQFGPLTGNIALTYSAPAIGSEFNYLTGHLDVALEEVLGGWGKARISLLGSDLLEGALPPQKLFFFDSRDAIIAPDDAFRTMSPFEFQGDQSEAILFEQNFYDLPTRALGIKMPLHLEWFGFANVAFVHLSSASEALLTVPVGTTTEPFVEAGFGIGNILNVLRLDATWRLTDRLPHNFFVTGTVAFSL